MDVSEKRSLRAWEYRLQMNRLVEVFSATRRHQKTKKTETQTNVRMAHAIRSFHLAGGEPEALLCFRFPLVKFSTADAYTHTDS